MNAAPCVRNRLSANDLQRVVEPLASYICAAEQPKSVLMAALRVLLREVKATNNAAITHFRAVSAN
jgi:hypothetical protein